jgi:hypothetical protein
MTYATDALLAQRRQAQDLLETTKAKQARVQKELDALGSHIREYEARVASYDDALVKLGHTGTTTPSGAPFSKKLRDGGSPAPGDWARWDDQL